LTVFIADKTKKKTASIMADEQLKTISSKLTSFANVCSCFFRSDCRRFTFSLLVALLAELQTAALLFGSITFFRKNSCLRGTADR
jgi:hypothetical protein